jgi:hypothetical protein
VESKGKAAETLWIKHLKPEKFPPDSARISRRLQRDFSRHHLLFYGHLHEVTSKIHGDRADRPGDRN